MQKRETLHLIVESGVAVVVRAGTEELAACIAAACAEGGAAVLEITFTVPGAVRVIESLAAARTFCLSAAHARKSKR